MYDEPNTADTWWDVDVSSHISAKYAILFFSPKSELPYCDQFPHSYLPLHFWLDKGMVTRRVKKYPMLLRPAWLPRQIRNASGNGGGVLIGYMPIVGHKRPFKNKYSHELNPESYYRNVKPSRVRTCFSLCSLRYEDQLIQIQSSSSSILSDYYDQSTMEMLPPNLIPTMTKPMMKRRLI